MQSLIRKHRVLFAWLIVLFIGVPMLFWGIQQPSGPAVDAENPEIARVGEVPVYAARFQQNLDAMSKQRAMGGERPTFAELDKEGVVTEVLDQMINSALIELEVKERGFNVAEDFLVKQLQKESIFKNEAGDFDPSAWNAWVETQERAGTNWRKLYDDLRDDLARAAYVDLLRAPSGRVLDSELEYQLTDDYTKIKVKYLQVIPPIDEASGELREYYDANVEKFRRPDSKTAAFASYSLRAPKPAKADELVAQARGGADFATLANENSDLKTENGGDMGWRQEREREQDHRKPMFTLKTGEVSEPIEGPNGFYIYKVEEERLVDSAGNVVPAETAAVADPKPVREVHVRQIFVQSTLSDEEKTAKADEAKKLADRAAELGNLPDAAKELGLELKTTGTFTDKSDAIEGIVAADVMEFRKAFTDQEISDYNVISARENVYVAVLASKEAGVIPAFEEVLEEVRTAFTSDSAKYKERVQQYADKIKAGAKNLAEAQAVAPDMTGTIGELDFFTRKDMLFQQQFYVMPTQIYEEIGRDPIGSMSAPLTDFRNNVYFIELADRQGPTEEDKAKWVEEKKTLRDQIASRKGMQLLEDYAKHLRETRLPKTNVTFNSELIDQIVGRSKDEPVLADELQPKTEATEAPATTTPAAETTAAPDAVAAPKADATPAPAETPAPAATEAPAAPAESAPAPAEAPAAQ